ncbi:MAG: SH3 domain-containing protein, partial [Bryobacteraceae bacterium]
LLPLCFVSCTSDSSDVLGKAYIAPVTVNLRRDLTEKNSTVAVLKHGDKVAIIDVRRIFLKVRAAGGAEGWLSSYDLLTSEQMRQIRLERLQARTLPSQGSATVYDPLNIHIEPGRDSPVFALIPRGGVVQVLAHRIAPRIGGPRKPAEFIVSRPEPKPLSHRRERRATGFRLPKPATPPPPANWIALSAGHIDAKPVETPSKPAIMEDWTLVRTKSNVTGWVLSRNLFMTVPADVEQYAEGKRITSYFDLGTVNDSERGVKHNWLWTTASTGEACDFDGWRVFLWNRRHHRYETSYRQRHTEGYFPVHVEPAVADDPGRKFELMIKDDDGTLRRRTYRFDGVRVHLIAVEDATTVWSQAAKGAKKPSPKTVRPGWFRRKWEALKFEFAGI